MPSLNLKYLFSTLPILEVIAKNLYGRFELFRQIPHKFPSSPPITSSNSIDLNQLLVKCRDLGVAKDDVLLVHSNFKQFAQAYISPDHLINFFTSELCPHGALVCPTFPLYRNNPTGVHRLSKDLSKLELTYDLKKTRPWTGDLGRALMRVPGSRRSLHPLNTLTALGPASEKIFARESLASLDLPCGSNSTWSVLADLNCKILMIDVDLAHSLTMIHVAEDCYEHEWPIKNWYRNRLFKIVAYDQTMNVTVRERHPKWSFSYAERRLSRDLYKYGIATDFAVGSLRITILESKRLLDFLNFRKRSAYPYYHCWLSKF